MTEAVRASYREADQWWDRALKASRDPDVLRTYAYELRRLPPGRFSEVSRRGYPHGDPRTVAVIRELRWRHLKYVDSGRLAARKGRPAVDADNPDVALERSLQRLRARGIYTGPKE